MARSFSRMFIGLLIIFFVAGCGVHTRQYVQVRDRVDQEPMGNAGYLAGSAGTQSQGSIKKTRKVYVLEFSKESNPEAEDFTSPPARTNAGAMDRGTSRSTRSTSYQPIVIPVIDDTENKSPAGATSFVDYTVEKDDTLQKISKKFYDGYSKWPRIYEANKDKLKDPNHLKPGITLRIPME
ncbi:MAG: LysM peptidoglycan-binding domain-containing protein [Candidatus Omnitrophota bacterium]